LSDRVLGESRSETVPASTVIAFTGNNIKPKGDLASRSLIVHLSADRTDPENRTFTHDDPMNWTKANRIEILKRLYAILRVERVAPNSAKTRFKPWWLLIGHPLELIANVDFEELFRQNDIFDEEAQGATEFITMMLEYLNNTKNRSREFSAADVAKLVEGNQIEHVAYSARRSQPDPSTLKSALEEASGRPFPNDRVTPRVVARKLLSIEGRPVDVNGELFHLVVKRDHEGNRYKIELLQ